MTEDRQLRGYAEPTIKAYVLAVSQLARFYRIAPDQLAEAQLRECLLHLSMVRKIAASSFTQTLCGLTFFHAETLGRHWSVLDVARPKCEARRPAVLSQAEVRQVLAAVRTLRYRVCLTVMYAYGLRLLEGLRLQASAVDGGRHLLHIRGGKGGKDRFVPLPDAALRRPSGCCAPSGARIAIRSGCSRPHRSRAALALPSSHFVRILAR
jgi:site-specific recombinase XerD